MNYDYLNDGFGYFSELATPYAQIQNLEKKASNTARSTGRWSCR